jgi:putative SOS response-associated peptidase YedK
MVFAGIWSPWREPAGGDWLLTAAVVTTAANETVGRLHNRMPVILGADEWPPWMDPTITDAGLLQDLLQPAPDDLLELVPVSALVNNVNNEGPDLVVPLPTLAAPEQPLTLFG